MDADFTRELIADFIVEAREHFDVVENSILELEKDPTNAEHLRNVFRAFHTIKGNATLLQLTSLTAISHRAENMLAKIRDEARPADSKTIDVILAATDILKRLVAHLEKNEEVEYDLAPIYERIDWEVNRPKSSFSPAPSMAETPVPPPSPPPQAFSPPATKQEQPSALPAKEEQAIPQQPLGREIKKSVGRVHLSTRQQNGTSIVVVAGVMDLQGIDVLLKEMVRVADSGSREIIVDLERVPSVTCLGLGGLWATHQSLKEKHGDLKLLHVQPNAQRIMQVTKLLDQFEIFGSLQDALKGS